ncbi:MAG: peptide chain release factor N(5)-glutamine methyltransferase [Actinomycetota bacterium]|nr:peptide chain release factor N(5)-glutamine methyltransferase [Actinomycetota bacterium]
MTVGSALARARDYLQRRGVADSQVDAELLLGHAVGLTRSQLIVARDRRLQTEELAAFEALLERRGRREPVAYVLGEWGFRRVTLKLDARALVPRPETEIVVERCLALLHELAEPQVLDVGTGSGAIALAIVDEHAGARVTAIESSEGALALAAENVARARLAHRIRLVRRDLVDGVPEGPFDLVVANPPYVAADELAHLEPEVREWEPRGAILDRGHTSAVITAARDALRAGGWLVLETHGERAREVARAVVENGYGPPLITEDLAGRERVVEARWPG